ncbi:MAG: beta-lactamase family protein, partial [Ardenticatenales bacterium]|nr:beta-lactamase family protein [Ardenticatenales bacterium]
MRLRQRCLILTVFSFVALLLVGAAQAAPVAQPEPDFDRIDRYIEAEMAADRVPGVALAIVQDGEIVHMRGFGVAAPDTPMTPHHAFVLGSMSKAFTAMAVMQLVE